jgi:hypothetical protein
MATCAVCVRHMHFLAQRAKKCVKSTDVLRVHHCRAPEGGANAEIEFGASRGGWVEACWDAQAFQGDAAVWYSVCARVCVQCAREGKEVAPPTPSHAALTCSWGCAV